MPEKAASVPVSLNDNFAASGDLDSYELGRPAQPKILAIASKRIALMVGLTPELTGAAEKASGLAIDRQRRPVERVVRLRLPPSLREESNDR